MPSTLRASHIAIGTELTSGQTLNTNSRFIAEFLRDVGVENLVHVIVPDTQDLILQSFDFAAKNSDWLFIYGGLGPTTDDFTRNMVAEWTSTKLVLDEPSWQNVQDILTSRGYPVRDFQKQQALFPEGSFIMNNAKGTAHGFHLSAKGKEIFVIPGPPNEVKSVFDSYLNKWILKNAPSADGLVTKVWNTIGLGESEVAFKIENLIESYDVTVGYRVHLPYVEVKITFLKSQEIKMTALVAAIGKTLEPILVYKSQYPYPDFFKSLLSSFSSLTLLDEVTSGGIFQDLKSWLPQWESMFVTYFNRAPDLSFRYPDAEAFIRIQRNNLAHTVAVTLELNKRRLEAEIPIQSLDKMPQERQPLFIKEMIYREILKQVTEGSAN